MAVQWEVDADGQAQELEVAETQLNDEQFSSCILDNLKGLQFARPATEESIRVAHKFRFKVRAPASVDFQ